MIYPPVPSSIKPLINHGTSVWSMETLKGTRWSDAEIETFLSQQVEKRGRFSRHPTEKLTHFKRVMRPFRRVTFQLSRLNSETTHTCRSLVDEQAAALVADQNHRFLLWRPRYVDLDTYEDGADIDLPDNTDHVRTVIDEMVSIRWQGQEQDNELRPKLREVQKDPVAVITMIVPRRPASFRREEKMLEESREAHAYVLASSMVTNSTPKDIILSYDLGARVLVETVVAQFTSISGDGERWLFLEMADSTSLASAAKAGLALTRIAGLYEEFKEAFRECHGV
ncbi:MAG: hypothetical protein ACP6KW_11615 [Candidatus Thorarchaeota archaeon]